MKDYKKLRITRYGDVIRPVKCKHQERMWQE